MSNINDLVLHEVVLTQDVNRLNRAQGKNTEEYDEEPRPTMMGRIGNGLKYTGMGLGATAALAATNKPFRNYAGGVTGAAAISGAAPYVINHMWGDTIGQGASHALTSVADKAFAAGAPTNVVSGLDSAAASAASDTAGFIVPGIRMAYNAYKSNAIQDAEKKLHQIQGTQDTSSGLGNLVSTAAHTAMGAVPVLGLADSIYLALKHANIKNQIDAHQKLQAMNNLNYSHPQMYPH